MEYPDRKNERKFVKLTNEVPESVLPNVFLRKTNIFFLFFFAIKLDCFIVNVLFSYASNTQV
jgi:hypothetical protein